MRKTVYYNTYPSASIWSSRVLKLALLTNSMDPVNVRHVILCVMERKCSMLTILISTFLSLWYINIKQVHPQNLNQQESMTIGHWLIEDGVLCLFIG